MSLLNTATQRRWDSQFSAIRQLDPRDLIPENQRYRKTIKDVTLGGFIRFQGKTYLVTEMGTYSETDDSYKRKTGDVWTELKLFCLETGEHVNIEWNEDDELELSATTDFLKFSRLRDDENGEVDEDDLDALVDEEDSLFLDGQEFEYEDDYASVYLRGGGPKEEPVYIYDFVSLDGTELTIEEWVIDPGKKKFEYQVFLSKQIDPNSIEILTTGG